jgi:TFIIF-interacting CTD phosphatase-like protein
MLNKLYSQTLNMVSSFSIARCREIVFNLQYAEITQPEKFKVFEGLGVELKDFMPKPKIVVPRRQRVSSKSRSSSSQPGDESKKKDKKKDPKSKAAEDILAIQSPSSLQAAMFDWASLPKVKEPFLPPKLLSDSEYTLVLDLDETLIHFIQNEEDSFFLIRPGCQQFLKELSAHFELVIFTAAMQDYADTVIDSIDPERLIRHRLYRQHTTFSNGQIVKDLNRIGRDITKAIIVDNVSENFCN